MTFIENKMIAEVADQIRSEIADLDPANDAFDAGYDAALRTMSTKGVWPQKDVVGNWGAGYHTAVVHAKRLYAKRQGTWS